MEIEEYFSHIELFKHLSDDAKKKLAGRSKKIIYLDDELITRQGDQPDFLWVVCKGKVEVFVEKAAEKKHVATLGPGEMFGEMSVFQNRVASASVVAHGKCGTIQIPGDAFREIISSSTASVGIIARKITGRFSDLMQKKKS